MKFIGGLALTLLAAAPALALPQDASSTAAGSATPVSVSLTPQQTCLATCAAGDVTCQAACVGTAHPNESQVNETTKCAEKCDQGDGSPAATEKYSQCVQACISSYFPTSQTVAAVVGGASTQAASNAATATGSVATGSASRGSGTAAATGSATRSASGTATGSGSAASASSSGNAASSNFVAPAAGLAGLLAVFAL